MLEFIRKTFRKLFEILLWVILVGMALSGLIGGAKAAGFFGALAGLIVGAIIGFLWAVIMGGVVTVILNIDKNLETLVSGKKAHGTAEAGGGAQENAPVKVSEGEKACGNCAKLLSCDSAGKDAKTCPEYVFRAV